MCVASVRRSRSLDRAATFRQARRPQCRGRRGARRRHCVRGRTPAIRTQCAHRARANFADPAVGAVTGELVLDCEAGPATDSKVAEGVGLYWKYEKWLRRQESRVWSTLGATGAIYAMRRTLWRPLPPETLLDDVLTVMRIVFDGKRVVFDDEARAFDRVAAERRRGITPQDTDAGRQLSDSRARATSRHSIRESSLAPVRVSQSGTTHRAVVSGAGRLHRRISHSPSKAGRTGWHCWCSSASTVSPSLGARSARRRTDDPWMSRDPYPAAITVAAGAETFPVIRAPPRAIREMPATGVSMETLRTALESGVHVRNDERRCHQRPDRGYSSTGCMEMSDPKRE